MRFSSILVLIGTCLALDSFPAPSAAEVKKPPVQYTPRSMHEFETTPFKEWANFTETAIGESAGVTFAEINALNAQLRPHIDKITHENFFRIFRLDLYKQCPFWSGTDGFCMHRSCAVDTIDDWTDLPDIWQPEALGAIENVSRVPETASDADYCEIDGLNEDTVYVDLVQNPERFTGYGGDQSFQIWSSIYSENCFNLGHDQCMEKNFFYKMVSGLHGSISTHLSNEYLDLHTKQYGPNLQQFMFRVGNYPDRVSNIYLNYILVLKALIKLESLGILDHLEFCTDEQFKCVEKSLKTELKDLIAPSYALGDHTKGCLFDESLLFQSADAPEIKDEFRQNFRNVSRIMDCVHCDRCRLWGKVQTTGYGTALKVLFDLHDTESAAEVSNYAISKMELIALVNTFDRLSRSVRSIQNFRVLYDKAIKAEEEGTTEPSEGTGNNSGLSELPVEKSTKPETPKSAPNYDEFSLGTEDYDDIVYPPSQGSSISEAFKTELANVWGAIKMVLHSYVIAPKLLYNWLLVHTVYYWNMFVGHVQEDFDVNRLYGAEDL